MPLDRFPAGHFASLHSPSRERRELGFAADPTKPTLPPNESQPENTETSEMHEQPNTGRIENLLQQKTGSLNHAIIGLTGNRVEKIPQNLLESTTVHTVVRDEVFLPDAPQKPNTLDPFAEPRRLQHEAVKAEETRRRKKAAGQIAEK